MTLRRFFIDDLLTDDMVIGGNEAHHMQNVLRLSAGDQVIIVATDGQAGIANIVSLGQRQITLKLLERLTENQEAPVEIVLVQGLPKSDKMDYIVQKAVELGVSAIIPLAADESVVKYDQNKQQARQARWQKIAVEAAKQCRRNRVPTVDTVQNLRQFLSSVGSDTQIIMLYEGQTPVGIKQALTAYKSRRYVLIIGPEGGFSADEVALAQEKGAQLVTMGPRILRTETAAVAAVTVVMYHHGDLGG